MHPGDNHPLQPDGQDQDMTQHWRNHLQERNTFLEYIEPGSPIVHLNRPSSDPSSSTVSSSTGSSAHVLHGLPSLSGTDLTDNPFQDSQAGSSLTPSMEQESSRNRRAEPTAHEDEQTKDGRNESADNAAGDAGQATRAALRRKQRKMNAAYLKEVGPVVGGARAHEAGMCRPCPFIATKTKCKHGEECALCHHVDHRGEGVKGRTGGMAADAASRPRHGRGSGGGGGNLPTKLSL